MADTDIIQNTPDIDEDQGQPPEKGPGPQQPSLSDENKQKLVKIITKMQGAGESDDNIRAVVKRFQEVNGSPPPTATIMDKGIRQTDANLNQPIQFNGTFTPDLEGEKKGLYLNDPEYQKQKNDFVNRIATDPQGNLLYPKQDAKTGKWSNYYTKQPLPNFDPRQLEGGILQVPHEYLPATGGQKFITPKLNPETNSYTFPGVETPTVPTLQTLPEATVYGKKGTGAATDYQGPAKIMVDESDKQKGDLRGVLHDHPELSDQLNETLAKYGPEYSQSLLTGSGAMSNVLQKTVEDHYELNKPLPENINPDILNGHLNVLNSFEKNRQDFEANQREVQKQADLLTDRSKRTGQPVSEEDAQRLAQKASANIQKWNEYKKSAQFSQNYVNQPEVKQYLDEFKKRQTGIKLIDEIRQRAFPDEVNSAIKQDAYDRKAIEGNLNAWDYTKTALGRAGSGLSNMVEGAFKLAGGPLNQASNIGIEKLNRNVQQFIGSNLPAISPEAIDEMNKKGMGHLVNDVSSMVGGLAPYVVPGLAGEGLGTKAATFATALAEGLPEAKQEAEKQGLTGSAYNTFIAARPLVSAAFMTLLPNAKFAKGFDNDVAKAVVEGEFSNPKRTLLNLATKVIAPHPGDIAHLQAMLSGTALGEALVNKITNGIQATEDLHRGIGRKEGLPVELSNAFNPRQTAVMAIAGKLMEAIPTLKNSIGDLKTGKDIQETYDHIENNLVELAGHNLEGVSNKVNELVKADPGNIYAQHLKTTLEDFAHAEARMPEGLEPEQKAALFNVQKQIEQKQRQMAYADPAYQPHLQKNIEELNKQITDILKDSKKANDYLKDSHKNFADNILSPKTESDGKTEDAQAEGQQGQIAENQNEGGQTNSMKDDQTSPLPIQAESWARTLDYGSNKGKEENKEAREKIKDEILNDRPIGGDGEKFSQLLGRVIPSIQKVMEEDPHNTTVVTHSSVIKALKVWEEMGRPDISELKGDKLKEFAQKYVDQKPEAEGKVHTFKGDNGNDIKVVRHGETEDNKLSEFREDDTKLTDKGQAQAAKAGENLITETGGNIPKIISSDLPRTMHTSDIINQKLKDHAVQIGRSTKVLQREPEETRSAGSGRERVESSQQRNESAGEGRQPGPTTQEAGKDTAKKDKVDEDWPFIEEESDNEFTSTKNAVTKRKIEEAGLEYPMREAAREFGTVWKDAQEKLHKGFDIEKLVTSLDKKPRSVTDLENAMILFHQNVKEAQLDAANKDIADAIEKKNPEDLVDATDRRAKLLDDLQSIYNVDKKIGRETARGLNARKMMADRRFSLVNMQLEKRAAIGGEKLSDEQVKEVQRQYEDIKKTKDALDARVAELENENARLSARQTISEQAKGAAKTRKTKQQYGTERKDIVQRMRADLLKAAKGEGGLQSSIPLAAQLKAIAPHIKDLVKSFIEEGVDKLEDITNNIYNLLKPDISDLEERHVHDLIAGVYNSTEPQKSDAELTPDQLAKRKQSEKYQQVKGEAKIQKYMVGDPKLLKLQADYERAKDKFSQSLRVDERKSRTGLQKTQDAFLKYERFAKLSNPITLGKLAMAAMTRLSTTPIEEAVGGLYTAGLPGIAKKAPGESGIHVNALAKGYKQSFMKGLDDAATVAKGGKSDLEAVFGKKSEVPPEALDFFGQLHSAIKAPVKRFAFERSFQKRVANNIKNGVTIDGVTEARIAVEAYKDAERSIFMQDNVVSKGWRAAMNGLEKQGEYGRLASTLGQWLIPFVKVPTNIIGETAQHVAGPEIALGQIISKSLGKGLKSLSQDEAESIMRNLKKGTIGHVALMAGYLNPQSFGGYYQKGEKRDEGDVKAGNLRIDGVNIPAWALEAPVFQAMQIGATVRRIKDTLVKGEEKGIGEGIWGGAMGLLSREPLLDEPSRLAGAMTNDKERGYFFGELAKSTLVPAASEYAAKVMDPLDTRSTGEKLLDPENKRQPATIKEHVESAIPGLREDASEKKPKGHAQRQRPR